MAKVASRSWIQLLNDKFPYQEATHFHVISPKRVSAVEQLLALQGDAQTIKHLTLPRLGRPPERIEPFIDNGQWDGPQTCIISGVRDPVARAVSVVGFLSNRLGYTRYPVTVRDGGTVENLLKLFHHVISVAQGKGSKGDQNDSLVSLLSHALLDYDLWFKEELAPAFDIDITDTLFDRDKRCLCIEGRHRLFVYRLEDILDANSQQRFLQSAEDFLGVSISDFPQEDVSRERRYRSLYSDFVSKVKLTESELAWFYESETVEKFYTPSEVEVFKNRWS